MFFKPIVRMMNPMNTHPHPISRRYLKKATGSILVFTVAFIVVLLGFLGMAVYTGLNAYVQNELQSATSTAAMVGAAAMYDTNYGTIQANSLGAFPTSNTANADAAARAVFAKIVAQSPILAATRMNGRLDPAGGVTTNAADDSIQVNALATIPTPFLSLLGVDSFQITANARAGYVKNMFRTDPARQLGGTTVRAITIPLQHPILDGPGPDLRITHDVAPFRGYMVEVCSGNSCVDISQSAVTLDNGVVVNRSYTTAGQTRTVIYGNAIFDLESRGVRKGTSIRIVDDGIPDRYDVATGQFQVEQTPTMGNIRGVEVYHHSTLCPAGVTISCQNSRLQNLGFFRMNTAP